MRPIACPVTDPPIMVSEIIDSTTDTWNKQKIETTFVKVNADLIMGLPRCTRFIKDFWSCNFETTGMFPVRYAYRMLIGTKQRRDAWLDGRSSSSDSSAEQKSWTTPWKDKSTLEN